MNTLIVHPSDASTDFLSLSYSEHKPPVLRGNCSKHVLYETIRRSDRIIFMGHGTPQGLIGFNRLFINSRHIQLLRTKQCNFIWCNAIEFAIKYKIQGFHTGMIISEVDEAYNLSIPCTKEWLEESNTLFAKALGASLFNKSPKEILESMLAIYKSGSDNLNDQKYNPIIEFNRQNLFNYEPFNSVQFLP